MLVSRVDVAGNACRCGLKMLLKLLVYICWDVTNPRACCVGLLDFSGSATQHLRIFGPPVWVSWISQDLLRSICVDVAGVRLKDVPAWVSRISPVLLRSIFVVYCIWEKLNRKCPNMAETRTIDLRN
jgi:hypothetical protein